MSINSINTDYMEVLYHEDLKFDNYTQALEYFYKALFIDFNLLYTTYLEKPNTIYDPTDKQKEYIHNPVYLIWQMSKKGSYSFIAHSMIRHFICNNISWCVPSHNMCTYIANHSKYILDAGAGSGYISDLLKKYNINVIAVDNNKEYNYDKSNIIVSDVYTYIKNNLNQILNYDLFFSWPRNNDLIEQCVNLLKPKFLYVIGEDYDGCTGFFENIDNKYDVEQIQIPQWYGIHDNLYVYKLKE